MKKLATLAFALVLSGTLTFAQTGSSSSSQSGSGSSTTGSSDTGTTTTKKGTKKGTHKRCPYAGVLFTSVGAPLLTAKPNP